MRQPTIYNCDRCKVNLPLSKTHTITELYSDTPRIDLCNECYRLFREFGYLAYH